MGVFLILAALCAQDVYFPEDRDRIELPLEVIDRGGYGVASFVEIEIGEARGRFLYDTGAALSLDHGFAEKLQAQKTTSLFVLGMAAVDMPHTYRVRQLSLGGMEFENHLFLGLDLDSFADRTDGIIGNEPLAEAVVELDCAGGRMVLHRRDEFEPPEGAWRVPLLLSMQSPECRVGVGDVPRVRTLIDTGNTGTFMLTAPFVERFGLLDEPDRFAARGVSGVFDGFMIHLARLPRLELGQVSIENLTVELTADAKAGMAANSVVPGNLGLTALWSCRVFFDSKRMAMFVLTPDGANRIEYRDALGLCLDAADGPVEIIDVIEASPGAKSVEVGDILEAIDGEKVEDLTAAARKLRAADRVALRLRRDGRTLDVVVERSTWLTAIHPKR